MAKARRMKAEPRQTIHGMAAELCKKFPDTPNRTLARRLQKDLNDTATLENCRAAIRRAVGAAGNRLRKSSVIKKPHGKAGTKPKMPPSQAEEWKPYEVVGPCRVLVLSDIHVPYHDETALNAAVQYGKEQNANIILLNGDFCDFYSISRFQSNPKKRNLQNELKAQREMLAWLRGQFPKQRMIYKNGNHCERWDHWLWNHAPEISDTPEMRLSEWLKLAEHKIEHVGDQRPVMLGKLPVLHGHELPKGLASPVNPSRGLFLRTCHTALMGHGHRTSSHAEYNMWHEEVMCWSQGCLCELNPEYARINKYNHGACFVIVHKDGSFDVENFRITKKGEIRRS